MQDILNDVKIGELFTYNIYKKEKILCLLIKTKKFNEFLYLDYYFLNYYAQSVNDEIRTRSLFAKHMMASKAGSLLYTGHEEKFTFI